MLGQKIGQYRVIERLGTGGMGSVFRASDEMLGREVALKVLDTTLEGSPARLRAEAAAMARLSHPGIATVYELIEDDSRLVMAMELVRGQTLQHILEQVGVFSARRAAELCMQALAALEHAHTAGVVHRDLKPGNLMLAESGSIKIMDFGIARLDGSLNLTNAGAMLGTPAYMAPEQVLGHPVDARTDLYAMGVVFFRLVTAAFPFKGETPFDMVQSQVKDAPAKASEMRADLPPWVDDILTRALAKKPADRFQTAMAFHEALARAIADVPQPSVAAPPAISEATEIMARPDFSQPAVATPPADPPRAIPAARTTARRSNTVWLTAGAVLVLAAGVWWFASHGGASPDNPETATVSSADSSAKSEPVAELRAPESTVPQPPPQTTAAAAVPAAAKAANTTPVRSTGSTPPLPTPAPKKSSAAPALPPASFSDVKFLTVNGLRTAASDVLVQFSDVEVIVQAADRKTAPMMISYQHIGKATYANGRDPKWDPALSAPAGKINVPGILGRARHWLVLQSADRYLILRLDGDDRLAIMKAFEERAGIVIDKKK